MLFIVHYVTVTHWSGNLINTGINFQDDFAGVLMLRDSKGVMLFIVHYVTVTHWSGNLINTGINFQDDFAGVLMLLK